MPHATYNFNRLKKKSFINFIYFKSFYRDKKVSNKKKSF